MTAFDTLALDIDADVKKFTGPEKAATIKGFHLRLIGKNGLLQLDPLTLVMEPGKVVTHMTYDSLKAMADPKQANRIVKIRTELEAVGLGPLAAPYLADLGVKQTTVGNLNVKELFAGNVSGVLKAQSRGRSLAELMAALDGSFDVALRDGKMSAILIEALGFDLTEAVGTLFSDQQLVDMPCLLLGLDADDGLVESRVILASTQDSNIYGHGKLDLKDESLDAKITTVAKDFSVGSFSVPIKISGTLKEPKVGLDSEATLKRLGVAAVLGAIIHPAVAIVGLVETGTREPDSCRAYASKLKALPFAGQDTH